MTDADGLGYRPFPNIERRNFLQARLEVPLFVRALRLPARVRVLEVGCGRGIALREFKHLLTPTLLVGVDVDPLFVLLAKERCASPGVAPFVMQADVRALPFADGSFEVVIDFGTCYHIDRAEKAILEITRVLVPGGVFATETKVAQTLAHPVRTRGRRLPLAATENLSLKMSAGMWATYSKRG